MIRNRAFGTLAATGLVLGLSALPASASRVATPTCSTVSVSMVESALGVSTKAPTSSKQTSGGRTTITCTYGENNSITYILGMSSAAFETEFQNLSKLTKTAKRVTGLGNAAMSFIGTSQKCASNNKCVTTNLPAVSVLHGTTVFSIQWTSSTLAKEEVLAREIVGRV